MKKIGFIDHFIDEFHANNYPKWIRESSFKNRFDVTLAWEETTPEGKKSLDRWCEERNIGKASSVEQIVKECDCIVVLSPDNFERHEDLARLPLASGKPVYIDKTFAPSLTAAKRFFDRAEKYNTPLMSSSALRFGSKLEEALRRIDRKTVRFAAARGGGRFFQTYAVHQIEMLVMTLGVGVKRIMQCGNSPSNIMILDYGDGRRAMLNLIMSQPFGMTIQCGDGECEVINGMDDFFPRFIDGMLRFFDTGKSIVPKEQTLEIIALVEAGISALDKPDTWIGVPR